MSQLSSILGYFYLLGQQCLLCVSLFYQLSTRFLPALYLFLYLCLIIAYPEKGLFNILRWWYCFLMDCFSMLGRFNGTPTSCWESWTPETKYMHSRVECVCCSFFSDCFNIIYLSQFLHDNLLNIFYTDVVVKMEPVDEEITINQG